MDDRRRPRQPERLRPNGGGDGVVDAAVPGAAPLVARLRGPPLLVVGLIVLWLDRRGITPPSFIAWSLGILGVVDAVILITTPWPLFLLACILLFAGGRRAAVRASAAPHADATRMP
ncbi:hypothetical protein Sgleb_64030 [Streptomyces glebosus]|uniref:Uncharacterized protein n=1 Tax=Streptomyces glebosus TaxID=249580 RepID=A0A640T7W9_9ACTN|nr:hypothetical protein [Streptomyces glebosus]GFE18356.1 hypothetical protein Sgleb_64030 [Streptomyces glebosus]GHG58269.1 hypothetical protein GCM10010513_22260 [Streptomyces glebosus]